MSDVPAVGGPSGQDDAPHVSADWVDTTPSRSAARWSAVLRHPLLAVSSRIRRQRGLSHLAAEPTSADAILRQVAELPISVWTYGFDHASVRHLGPMAQDFAKAFGLGSSDRRIDMVDANGVALASIQALYRRVVELEQKVTQLQTQRENPAESDTVAGPPDDGRPTG